MKYKKLLDNNTVIIVISILCAILTWMMVAYNVDTSIPVTIKNVPVILNSADNNLERLGLYPVTNTDFTVDVDIVGPRATVGNIKAAELQVMAKLNNVSGPGTYELALEITDMRNRGVEIKGTVPDVVQMRFDTRVVKKLPVKVELSGLSIPDGYVMGEEYVYPAEVEVSGPATEMKNVETANIKLSFDDPLSKSVTYDQPVELRGPDASVVESPYFEFDSATVSITLPILKKKTVPVTFNFVNIPEDFDIETLDYVISPKEIEVAGPEDMLSSMNEIHLGYIDVRTLAPDVNLFYGLSLPPGFISVESVDEMNVQFMPDKFGEKELNIDSSSIYVINASDKYSVSIQSKGISGVMIYGPKDDVEMITAKDLVAQIDMSQVDYKTGQITVPVDILVPGKSTCWACGVHYTVIVTIKSK